MDNNVLESDNDISDNDDEFIDSSPFLYKCQNEVVGIDSLSKCFERRYDACPAFFMGSLREACQEAFNPTISEERRPVLVYIHNDESLLSKKFCRTIFCHTTVIDYLLDNYIVWAWDITLDSNKNTLEKIWEEIFSRKFFDDFSIEECPLLIGIIRLFEYKIDELITSEYQYKSLLKGDILTCTQQTINREILLNELCMFKKQCYENELDLSFNFSKMTNLCWEIILEIAKYLSLNDAISAFSTNILPLLNNSKLKFQLSNPNVLFIKMILQKFKREQIVSLQLNALQVWPERDLTIFKNIISITLLNLPYNNLISQYEKYFSNLTCLSLCYDNEVDLNSFSLIFKQVWERIKRFEIHCAGTLCNHYDTNRLNRFDMLNYNVEYFLFDVNHFPLISMKNCFRYYRSCFLMTIIDLIKKMINIRYIHLIINKYDIEQLLDIEAWAILVSERLELKKITLQVLGNTFQNEQLMQKVLNIQTKMRNIRQTIQFQIKFL